MPGALSVVFKSAEAVEQRVAAVAVKVEYLTNQIPAVIERIEQSDVGRSVDILVADIADSRSDLKDFRKAIVEIENIFEGFGIANGVIFAGLATELEVLKSGQENLNSAIGLLRAELVSKLDAIESAVTKSIAMSENGGAATVKAYEVIVNALKNSTDIQSQYLRGLKADVDGIRNQEISLLKQELKLISHQMLQQGAAIEALAKKKGFSF